MFSFAHVKDSESGNSILEIWNPGLWNPVYSSRNPESYWLLESGIQYLESGMYGVESRF